MELSSLVWCEDAIFPNEQMLLQWCLLFCGSLVQRLFKGGT